jgi:hypothetical protein
MGGAAVGDLDPETPGNEVVAVTAAGEVWLVGRAGAEWRPTRIYQGDGELIMGAVGDADPRYAGNEFVGVGMVSGPESRTGAGQVLLIHRDGAQWKGVRVFQDDHMLHGVAIGDVSSRHAGNEIVACGFNHRVTLLSSEQGGWRHETIYVGNNRMKIALVGDVLPQRDGVEVIVCGSDGNVVALWEGPLGWHHEVVFTDPVGQSRIAVGHNSVLIGGDRGKVTLALRRGGHWTTEFIARDSGKIRGVAIADIDPAQPGDELYACGYSRHVRQFVRDVDGYWNAKVIFTAQRPLHHLVVGEFDSTHPGPELVTCGHGGRLVALFPRN